MQKLACSVLLTIVAIIFAHGQSAPKANPTRIVFDDWWNVDYVKNGCELSARNTKPCPTYRTPQDVVKDFENKLEVAFASEAACHGLSMVHFTSDMANTAVKNPNAPATGAMAKTVDANWTLMLDLDGHSHTQVGHGWTLVDSKHHVFNGSITSPERVVQKTCRIVKGIGGKPEN
ncbi:MAG TPA: hypothetical protein VGR72_02830 [Candidatus Acidoferrales bacterium]|nr:hypothetical protein [Candidatus Acidoferrales bacterium]